MGRANRKLELKESMTRIGPGRTGKILGLLGESKRQIKAKVGAETTTMVYMIWGA